MYKYKIDSWGRLVPCNNEETSNEQQTTCPDKNRERPAEQGPSGPRKRRTKGRKKLRHGCHCRCRCCRHRARSR